MVSDVASKLKWSDAIETNFRYITWKKKEKKNIFLEHVIFECHALAVL